MSEFKYTDMYSYIYNQIEENWNDEDRDGDDIEEFKYYYGNHENSIYYYDFDTSFNVFDVLKSQRFIIEKCDDLGLEVDIAIMQNMTKLDGLQKQLVYWIMEDFCDELVQNMDI